MLIVCVPTELFSNYISLPQQKENVCTLCVTYSIVTIITEIGVPYNVSVLARNSASFSELCYFTDFVQQLGKGVVIIATIVQ